MCFRFRFLSTQSAGDDHGSMLGISEWEVRPTKGGVKAEPCEPVSDVHTKSVFVFAFHL